MCDSLCSDFFFFLFRFSWLIKALFRRFCSVLSPPSIHSTRWSSPERVLNNQLAWFHQTTSLHWSSTGFERKCCTTMFHLPFNHKLDCPFGSYIILVLELKSSWINFYLSFINCLFLLFVFFLNKKNKKDRLLHFLFRLFDPQKIHNNKSCVSILDFGWLILIKIKINYKKLYSFGS